MFERRWFRSFGIGVVCLALAACQSELHLTPAPKFGANPAPQAPHPTHVGVGVPVDTETLGLAVQTAVTREPVRVLQWVRRAGCGQSRRGGCFGARIDGEMAVAGAPEISPAADGTLSVRVPVRYDLRARGLRKARSKRQRLTGTFHIAHRVSLHLTPNLTPVVKPVGPAKPELTHLNVFGTRVSFAEPIGKLHRSWTSDIVPRVADAVTVSQFSDGVSRGWIALQSPISFGDQGARAASVDAWIIGEPLRLTQTRFAAGPDGRLVARATLRANLRLGRGAKPNIDYRQPLLAKYVGPQQSTSSGQAGANVAAPNPKTVLPITTDVPLTTMNAALKQAIGDDTVVAMQVTPTSAEIGLRVADPVVRPAQRFVAISFAAEVLSPPRFAGLSGRVHLVGRPSLDATRGAVVLQGVSFPVIAQSNVRRPRQPIPLEASALVERIGPALRLGISEARKAALASATRIMRAQIDAQLTLSGQFDDVSVESVVPSEGGIRLTSLVRGDLLFLYRANAHQAAARQNLLSSGLVDQIRKLANN